VNHSDKCVALVKSFEGCQLHAYADLGGIPSIGWGHTKDVRLTDSCSKPQANKWLEDELTSVARCIDQNSSVRLSQNQFDALVSFAYNLGWPALATSTLWRTLMAGDVVGAEMEFPRWCHVKKVEVAGLKRRRAAEQAMFKGLA